MTIPYDSLTSDPRNANLGTDEGLAMVGRSLEQLGAGRSILATRDGVVIAGNKTLDRARELGIPIQEIESDGSTLYVIKRTDLAYEDPRAKQLAIADNRTAEVGLEWDLDVLEAFESEGIDLSGFWTEDQWAALLGGLEEETVEGLVDPDEIPETPEDPITEPGDLWVLGRHRVLCGDSTVAADVERLMDGHAADLLVTDPPYGVAYVGGTKEALTIQNDNLGDAGTRQLVADALAAAPLKPGGVFYVFSAPGTTETAFRLAIADAGLQLRQCLVWVKQQFVLGRQDYHGRHESILYGWAGGGLHYFLDDRTQDTVIDDDVEISNLTKLELLELVAEYRRREHDTVWREDRPHRSEDHPTMKPVRLIEKAIRNSSRPRERVLDLFGGSGTTVIACEQTRRTAYAMELDPRYCDVIVRRWQDFTGQTAHREAV